MSSCNTSWQEVGKTAEGLRIQRITNFCKNTLCVYTTDYQEEFDALVGGFAEESVELMLAQRQFLRDRWDEKYSIKTLKFDNSYVDAFSDHAIMSMSESEVATYLSTKSKLIEGKADKLKYKDKTDFDQYVDIVKSKYGSY